MLKTGHFSWWRDNKDFLAILSSWQEIQIINFPDDIAEKIKCPSSNYFQGIILCKLGYNHFTPGITRAVQSEAGTLNPPRFFEIEKTPVQIGLSWVLGDARTTFNISKCLGSHSKTWRPWKRILSIADQFKDQIWQKNQFIWPHCQQKMAPEAHVSGFFSSKP